MPLQSGTWTINASGNMGKLEISDVDALGNITGSLTVGSFGPSFVTTGTWDEAAQRLAFHVYVGDASSGFRIQAYTGFLFKDSLRMPAITGGVVFTLVGSFQSFRPPANADQFQFGWYAQLGVA